MSHGPELTLQEAAAPFAGLDTKNVFADFSAGRGYIYGGDVVAAAEQVKASHPEHAEALDELTTRVRRTSYLWD